MPALQRLVSSDRFQLFITWVILFAAVLVGLETSRTLVSDYGGVLHALDTVVLGIFILEIALKLGALWPKPWQLLQDPWNVFDVIVVAAVFLPIGSQYATVLRLARLLRVLRLIHAVPRLQILVSALLRSIPSMGYVSLLLLLVFYMYGVAGVFLFGHNDPFRFGTLPIAFVTLFQVATAEDWATTLYTQMYGCDQFGYDGREALCVQPLAQPVVGPIYFITFILVGTMVILNLFIGVIMNSMSEAEAESDEYQAHHKPGTKASDPAPPTLSQELVEVGEQLQSLQARLQALTRRAQTTDAPPSKS